MVNDNLVFRSPDGVEELLHDNHGFLPDKTIITLFNETIPMNVISPRGDGEADL
jgi:hypothetical protein